MKKSNYEQSNFTPYAKPNAGRRTESETGTWSFYSGRSKRGRILTVCALAAAFGMMTFTAAAANFGELISTRTGTYGLNVKVEDNRSESDPAQAIEMKFGYLPDEYTDERNSGSWFDYKNNDDYFNAYIIYCDNFEDDYTNVIETNETVYNGHKTLFITFKEAENTDRLFYSSIKYFDDYNCLIRCNCSDIDKLIKITEQVEAVPAPEDRKPVDVRDEDCIIYGGALEDYKLDGFAFRDQFFSDKVKSVQTGEPIELSVADYDQESVKLTAKVVSFRKQDNIDGLDKNGFIDLGTETTFDMFFAPDGSLKKERTSTVYEGADEEHLGTAKDVTYKMNFYVADIELTAGEDIDNLHAAFGTDVFIFKDNVFSEFGSVDDERALVIYGTKANSKLSLKKGETVTIKTGFITENDIAAHTYLSISAVDAQDDNYQNYMVKVRS